MSIRLSDEQYEFIKGEVVAIFEKYDVRCIPISGFELAVKMGIKLTPYSSLNNEKRLAVMRCSPDGFYVEHCNGKDYIYYNDIDIVYERINMTILHEIGHCVLDHTGDLNYSEEEEAEAAFFAKYAIAPPPLVHRILPESPEDILEVFKISYEASIYAFNYYLKWLNYGKINYMDYELRMLKLFEAA